MIRISRNISWTDRFRAYKIVLDGKVIGKINQGETTEYEIPSGMHHLHLKIDWCKSNILHFNYDGKSTIYFECGSNVRGKQFLKTILNCTLYYNRYIWLHQT